MKAFPNDARSSQALDDDLDLSRRNPGILHQIERHQSASRAILDRVHFTTVQYGSSASQSFVDITPPDFKSGNGIVIFVHGGYWRAYGAKDFIVTGNAFLDLNKKMISVDYPLAPMAKISDIVLSVDKAFEAVAKAYPEEAIWAVGHSAGAHLVAACCLQREKAKGATAARIERAYMLSGLYDLRPVRKSFLQETLGIDEYDAVACSPILHRPRPGIEYWLLHGSQETGIFKAQSEEYFRHLIDYSCKAHRVEIQADHFSIMGSDWLQQAEAAE